ncbi:hypothetical protein GTO91_03120 [Heliobacterium undosum]|uniref:Uncharacterized protein n=1 Tax=Heliomicrobium undosum TaxID=121734 RepID=A0A845L2H9_9FIRM|nr:hypothetical protein [Heliomicrobium undosum]MZP28710.1 hypothetical protein [Heliomicrobium undosum]
MDRITDYIQAIIADLWVKEVSKDYNDHFLLKEDSLKCAFYYYLRLKLGDGWLIRHRIRVYPEYHLSKRRKADLAIVRVEHKSNRKGRHLSECVEDVLAIIEFKYKVAHVEDPFIEDRNKLRSYAEDYKEAHLYACFVHEKLYENPPSWFDGRQTNGWAEGRVSELIGYWNLDGEYKSDVRSY